MDNTENNENEHGTKPGEYLNKYFHGKSRYLYIAERVIILLILIGLIWYFSYLPLSVTAHPVGIQDKILVDVHTRPGALIDGYVAEEFMIPDRADIRGYAHFEVEHNIHTLSTITTASVTANWLWLSKTVEIQIGGLDFVVDSEVDITNSQYRR